jgi:adenylate cyclase
MEIYASIISNFTQKDFISRNHQFIPILFTFIFAVIVTFSFIYGMRVSFVGGFSIVLILLWLLLAGILFKMDKLWLDVTIPVTSIIFSFALAAAISYQTEGKARKRLKNTFSRYLSPIVISELIEKSEDVGLGGKEINGTVYFSDIKDFTTVSESLSPSELVSLLNDYFGIVSEEILHRGGLLDKYIGDAVMAVFGAPLTHHDHAIQACSAALGVQRLLAEQWIKVGRGRPPLETRIGINTGPMVVGNIGSPRRLDYTAIGDTVNLASRLEGANKVYKTNIIVSASTLQFTRDLFVVRELDLIRAKGKKKPTSIYEVIGVHNEVPEQVLKRNRIYHEGIELFREKQFAKSKKAFERVLAEFQNDGPSSVYIQRCEYFITHPPTMDWDGVFTMESK